MYKVCKLQNIFISVLIFFPLLCRADTFKWRDENCNGVLAYLKLKTDNSITESLALDEEGKLCTLTKPKTHIISRESLPVNEECKPCTLTKVEDLRPVAISNIVDSSNSTNETIEKAESQENTLNCKECGKKYQHYSSLYKHMRQVHSTV